MVYSLIAVALLSIGESNAVDSISASTVTASRAIVPQQVLNGEQLQRLSSSSVADALKYFSGVQIKDYGGLGGQKTINVRSLGSQHVGVFVDGVRITNVQNGTVDLGKYSLANMESVSLYNANKTEVLMAASEYASAATVYLRTRQPEESGLSGQFGTGSFGTRKGSLHASYKKYIFVDGEVCHSDGDYPFEYHTQYEDTTGTRRNSDIDYQRIEAGIFWKKLRGHLYFYNSERGLPGGVVRRMTDLYTDVGREWDRNAFAQLSYTDGKGNWSYKVNGRYANDHLHYCSDYPENIAAHADNRYHQQDAYLSGALAYSLRYGALSGSADIRWADLNCDVKNSSYVYRLDSKTALAYKLKLGRFAADISSLYTYITDHSRGSSKPLSRLTGSAHCSYTVLKAGRDDLHQHSFILRAFYKEVFRAPTLNDLYYTLVGNRNLKPELTRQGNLGVAYNYGSLLDIQADVYYNRIKDRIVCLPLKGSYQWTMLNYGQTRCAGLDVTARVRKGAHSLLLTGTYQDDRNRTDKSSSAYNDQIAYSPKLTMTGVYSVGVGRWGLSLSHMYVGKRYWMVENDLDEPLSAYNCTDAKVTWTSTRKRLMLAFDAQDIFDSRYEMIQRWPMPGRRFMFTVKITLN